MSSQAPLLFLIVGRNEPLYSAEFTNANDRPSTASDSTTRQNYFVMHSALDLVDKQVWTTSSMYLKVVDKVNHQLVSAFLTASHVKFLLLHQGRSDDTIKFFFQEIYELYVKISMNPFYKFDSPITSEAFNHKVKMVGRKYFSA